MNNKQAINYASHVHAHLLHITEPIFTHYPAQDFVYAEYLSPTECFHLSTNLKWTQHYLTQSSHGETLNQVIKQSSSGKMSSIAWTFLGSQDPIEQFAVDIDLRFGLNIYQWWDKKLKLWSFAGKDMNTLLFLQLNQDLLEQFIFYFNEACKDFITEVRVRDNKAIWANSVDFGFCSLALTAQTHKKSTLFSDSYLCLHNRGLRHKLTARQWEFLKLYSQGISYKNIAKKFHISPRTVEHTLVSARTKIGLVTREDLLDFVSQNSLIKNLNSWNQR